MSDTMEIAWLNDEIDRLRAERDEATRERDALQAMIDSAAVENVGLDDRGYTVILPPIEWECGKRVALVPLDD